MPRQKKIVPYVPNTPLPDGREMYRLLWNVRDKYTLADLLNLADIRSANVKGDNSWNNRAYHTNRLEQYSVTEDNWREVDSDGTPKHPVVSRLLQSTVRVSNEFNALNDAFLAEYDSREDLQELYKKFYTDLWAVTDRYGNQYHRHYANDNTDRQQIDALYGDRPETFMMFQSVADTHSAREHIEKNRPTPYEPGDLVRLRDPYVDHPDHDPLHVDRWQVLHRGATPTPPKSQMRLGTVMRISDKLANWRAGKGSKLIEVLWHGQETPRFVQEKILKWMERPTKKNGLLK